MLADFNEQGSLPVGREDLNINARGVDTWDALDILTLVTGPDLGGPVEPRAPGPPPIQFKLINCKK